MQWIVIAGVIGGLMWWVKASEKVFDVPVINVAGQLVGKMAAFPIERSRPLLPPTIGPRVPDYYLDVAAGATGPVPAKSAFLFQKVGAASPAPGAAVDLTQYDVWVPPFSIEMKAGLK